jgi:hypothetical protein
MSDYFTHLAARAIAPPSLRPRTPSRFEPVEEPAAVRAIAIAPRRPPAIDRETAAAPAAGEDRGVAAAPAAGNDGARSGRRSTTTPRVERVVERDVERMVETRDRVVHVPARTTERTAEPEPQPRLPHRFDAQPPRVITQERRNTIRERDIERRDRVIRTTIDRNAMRMTAPPPEARTETAASEPVVHVSIGRVEVRAIAQTAPQRAGTRKPAMTIDDYVARRKTKERR